MKASQLGKDSTPQNTPMSLQEQFRHSLPLIDPLPVTDLAKAEALPPILTIDDIAKLWASSEKFPASFYNKLMKKAALEGKLKMVTLQEYIDATMDHESSRKPEIFDVPPPNTEVNIISRARMIAVAHTNRDIIPEVYQENKTENKPPKDSKKKMFSVAREALQDWLKEEAHWPLSKKCLLSRWWPEEIEDKTSNKQPTTEEDYCFRLEKDYWRVKFQQKTYSLKNLAGMKYITKLIERAYSGEDEILVTELFQLVNGTLADLPKNTQYFNQMSADQLAEENLYIDNGGVADGILDQRGIERLKERIQKINDMIEDAEEIGDIDSLDKLKTEKESIIEFTDKSLDHRGKARKFKTAFEKPRKNIQKNIKYSLDKIGLKEMDPLAVYLKTHIKTGVFCSFLKDPEIKWKIYL